MRRRGDDGAEPSDWHMFRPIENFNEALNVSGTPGRGEWGPGGVWRDAPAFTVRPRVTPQSPVSPHYQLSHITCQLVACQLSSLI